MEHLKIACNGLVHQIDLTVDLLVKQNMEEAVTELLNTIDLMYNTIELVITHKEPLQERGIIVNEQDIIDLLNQVVEAINNTDFVLVADLLNYEIKVFFEQCTTKL